MAAASSVLMFALLRLHSSSAARMRPSTEQRNDARMNSSSRNNGTQFVAFRSVSSSPRAPSKADMFSEITEQDLIVATRNRSLKEVSSILDVKMSQGGIMTSASRLLGVVVALVLLLSGITCLCSSQSRDGAALQNARGLRETGSKFRATEKLSKHCQYGYAHGTRGNKTPSRETGSKQRSHSPEQQPDSVNEPPSPSSFVEDAMSHTLRSFKGEQEDHPPFPSCSESPQASRSFRGEDEGRQPAPTSFVEKAIAHLSASFQKQQDDPEPRQRQRSPRKPVNFGEVVSRLSQTIKKVPTGRLSFSLHRSFGINPQERHVAVWWGGQAHTWPTARLGWWKTKQAYLDHKEPKGDFFLKHVTHVRLTDENDGFSDSGVCVSRKEGEDDLLIFFPDSDLAEQFFEDLSLLVRKVKRAIKAETNIKK